MLDEIEEIEEIAKGKSWDVVFAAMSAEKGEARPSQDYDSRVFSGLSPSQRKKKFQGFIGIQRPVRKEKKKTGTVHGSGAFYRSRFGKTHQAGAKKPWKVRVIVEEHCKDLLEAEVIEPSANGERESSR